ncbi:MAG TPA: VOC family protein, partial [Acidimicrobiales bacterium]|nr:VOC family protein [Acidimicrobiales bacterium]
MPKILDIHLDHVAVAVERQAQVWDRYAGQLPSRWLGGGTAGFASAQVEYANGMKLEVLEPYQVDQNDFLRRFLDRNGPGPHHLTFKVRDIIAALRSAEQAGYRPINVNLELPWWKEAFLHPKDAPGVVVQLAASHESDWGAEMPDWFPRPRVADHAALVHVGHAVADLDVGRHLFVDLLAGEVTGEGEHHEARWLDLAWPGAGRVRLIAPAGEHAPLRRWLGSRDGRVHHLAFSVDAPGGVLGAVDAGDVFEVPPDANYGVRLLLASSPAAF